jgi:hypothetical protein
MTKRAASPFFAPLFSPPRTARGTSRNLAKFGLFTENGGVPLRTKTEQWFYRVVCACKFQIE